MFDGRVVVSVVAVAVSVVAIVLFASSISSSGDAVAINPRDAPEIEEPEVIEDFEAQARAEYEREILAYEIAASDTRIQELTKDTYNHNMGFAITERGDEVTVHIVKQRHVEGDYMNGYTITNTGRKDVKMIIRDGEIVSTDEIPLPDRIKEITYTDEEKKIIEAALADTRAEELGAADVKYIGTDSDVRVFTELECPNSECVTVMMEEASGHGWIRVLVDSDDMSIVEVQWVLRE